MGATAANRIRDFISMACLLDLLHPGSEKKIPLLFSYLISSRLISSSPIVFFVVVEVLGFFGVIGG